MLNVKYALIGCGRVAPSHIKAARENGVEIVAVCDIDYEKAVAFSKNNSLENINVYDDYKVMLQNEELDFVSIATISGTHAEIACYCAENKVNFLVEKPMAMSISDANKMIYLAEENSVIAGVCHQNRFNIAIQELKNAIDGGRFGKLSHGSINVRWCRGKSYYDQDSWRGKWATDGGALMNQCIHGIDLLRWLMGNEIESVYGSTRNIQHPYIEAEDVGVAVINFKNGAVGTVEGTVNAVNDLEETLTIFGEKGMVKVGGMNANKIDVWQFNEEDSKDTSRREIIECAPNVYGHGHTSLFLDFKNAIKENRQPYVTLQDGKNGLEVVLSIYKSQKSGEKVNLPLDNFKTEEMQNTF